MQFHALTLLLYDLETTNVLVSNHPSEDVEVGQWLLTSLCICKRLYVYVR